MTDPITEKQTLRREITNRLKDITSGAFHQAGIAAAALLQTTPLWQNYQTLLIFLSMKDEIDTQPLLEAALAAGKKVFAPKLRGPDLQFIGVMAPEGPWGRDSFGIRAPANSGPLLEAEHFPALIITPGLGFDKKGGRLGRGKGFYDRFFSALQSSPETSSFFALGLCMPPQILPEIPLEKNDLLMDAVCDGLTYWNNSR
ncbi:hypothetical protein FACS189461_2870 [Spirochaetia bacterium]|nr:hypothetical protein FACS189461_2870 [Spirochaetia bacterium]